VRTVGGTLVLTAALLAGCGGDSPSTAPPAGLTAAVQQSRDNETRHLLQAVLVNSGSAPVHVVSVQVRTPLYQPGAAKEYDDVVTPGQTTAFPVPYGDVVCGSDPAAGTSVVAVLREGSGTREVHLPVPASDPDLPRLHARDCTLDALRHAVDVGFGPWQRSGADVTGTLVLTRRAGSGEVRLTDTESSILFLLQPAGPLPLVLADGATRAALQVTVTPVRCDPHALIESKRSFTFPVFVGMGAGTPVQSSATADAAGQALMMAVLRDRCQAEGIPLQ
jgi:hypothetical protein